MIAANEVLSEAVRPLVLPRMAIALPDFGAERPTHPLLPIGFTWRHHKSLQAAVDIRRMQAEKLATACNSKVVIAGLDFLWVLPHFKSESPPAALSWNSDAEVASLRVQRQGRESIIAFNLGGNLNQKVLRQKFPGAPIIIANRELGADSPALAFPFDGACPAESN